MKVLFVKCCFELSEDDLANSLTMLLACQMKLIVMGKAGFQMIYIIG